MVEEVAQLIVGKRGEAPEINIWLERNGEAVMIVAKHSADNSDQRIAHIDRIDGRLVVLPREIHTPNLCAAFGIPQGGVVPTLDFDVPARPARPAR